jgi:diguanylate cyclase (GGDEF)-like protein
MVSGVVAAAAVCVAAAPLSAVILLRGRKNPLLAAVLPAFAVSLVVAASEVLAGSHPPVVLAGTVAIGSVVATVLLTAGTLALPTLAGGGRARLRHVLDGLVVASSLFYAAWTLVIGPLHVRFVGGPVPLRLDLKCLVVAGPVLVGLVATGVLAALGISVNAARRGVRRADVAGRGVRRACAAGAVAVAAGAALPAAVYFGQEALTVAAAGVFALAGCALAVAVQLGARGTDRVPDQPPGGLGLALAMVGVALLAGVLRMTVAGTPNDRVGGVAAAVIGATLAAQQVLARYELRRTAEGLVRSEAYFRSMAYTDPLTELANRRQLLSTLQEQADAGPPGVLIAIDLDGFKNVNDIRGHDVGDAVLVEVASRLRANVRPGDLAVRMGGDEFAVLMWARPAEAGAVAERLLAVLSAPYEVAGATVFLSASVGLATWRTADTMEGLMRNADVALRFAKQRGKHRVEQYDLAYDRWLRRRTEVEHELRGAVERGELMVVYQPIAHLPGGRIAGVEALLRWHNPQLGQVSPAEFIPVAEDAGLVAGLGAFVLHEACYQLARWLADGHEVYLSVNASVRELHTPEYAERVADVLRVHKVPAQRLVIEVTEHVVALDVEQLVERLTALRAGGVRVALDDFGSGYSSLGQLRTLPVDILKIDRSLVAPTEPARFAPPLADVVVQLGNRLGLDVVAEGVTDEGQRKVLVEAGCRYAQGDLFGRPMPAERVEALFGAVGPAGPTGLPVQNVRSVDSGHEMRQS